MKTVSLLNSLIGHFSLPALQVKETASASDWRWVGTNIEIDLFVEGMDEDYVYRKQVDIRSFQEVCELTNEIPEYGFCEWFDNLKWEEQVFECSCYGDRLLPEIKADYAAWIGNHKKAI